ncbi:MAG: DUF3883 domain-containing protein [Oscillospiraceae bacterium]|nr:DUF3883 domain-containing protein [Oscillospiraceae bacterium]
MDIFNVLYQVRLRLGLSQNQVAIKTGLTPNDISRFEKGRLPSLGKCIRISETMGIDIDALVRNDLQATMSVYSKPAKSLHKFSKKMDIVNARMNDLGRKGEDYVYAYELDSLKGTDLVNSLNPNIADDPNAGFDILSFFPDGAPKYIEVKTTTGKAETFFEMTASEVRKMTQSLKNGENYFIYRVHHYGGKKQGIKIITASELLKDYKIIEKSYYEVRSKK